MNVFRHYELNNLIKIISYNFHTIKQFTNKLLTIYVNPRLGKEPSYIVSVTVSIESAETDRFVPATQFFALPIQGFFSESQHACNDSIHIVLTLAITVESSLLFTFFVKYSQEILANFT